MNEFLELIDLAAEATYAATEDNMQSGPANMRDQQDDWREVEECLEYIESQNPTLAQYAEWLRTNEHVPQDLDVFEGTPYDDSHDH